MTDQSAGWYPDPFGAAQQRYWDGTSWTAHTHGAPTPEGPTPTLTPPPPQPQPSSPVSDGAPLPGGSIWTWLDGLGEPARRRPAPRLSTAVGGIGGALVAFGVLLLLGGDGGSRGGVAAGAAIVTAAAVAARLRVSNPDVRAAAVGAGLVGIIALVAAALPPDDEPATFGLLAAAALVVAWVAPGFRGSSMFLGVGSLLLVFGVASAFDGSPSVDECMAAYEETFEVPDGCEDVLGSSAGGFSSVTDGFADLTGVYLVFGAAFMSGVWLLDRRGFHGVGTSLVAAALVSSITGLVFATISIAEDGPGGAAGAAVLAIAVGLIICTVGSLSPAERRATTWWGAAIVAVGTVTFLASVVKPDSFSSIALVLLVSGALLALGPTAVHQLRAATSRSETTSSGGSGARP